jgi:hypothetical protein
MTGLLKICTQFGEIEGREAFASTTAISTKNFRALVQPYRFSSPVHCQVLTAEGMCGNSHLKGWLGVTREGKEGLIGVDCAGKYFHADRSFALEKRRMQREIRISERLAFLEEKLADRAGFAAAVDGQIDRLRVLRAKMEKLMAGLGSQLRQTLKGMEKTGNRAVYVQVRYVEVDENGKERSEWLDHAIGTVMGTSVCRSENLTSAFSSLKELKLALPIIHPSPEAGERKLKQWMDLVGTLPALQARVERLYSDYLALTRPKVLSLLVFLTTSVETQLQIAKTVLEHSGTLSPSNNAARKYLSELTNSVGTSIGSRDFRTRQ